jgi:hypothetical protein
MTAPWRVARRGSDSHLHQRGVNRGSRPLLEIHPRRAPASPTAAATTGDKALVYNFRGPTTVSSTAHAIQMLMLARG